MPGKRLITERDVLAMRPGAELVLGADVIATPAALDAAHLRGLRVVRGKRPAPAGSDLWARLKSSDGTYVVQVSGGRAVVSRLGAAGPEVFGEE